MYVIYVGILSHKLHYPGFIKDGLVNYKVNKTDVEYVDSFEM